MALEPGTDGSDLHSDDGAFEDALAVDVALGTELGEAAAQGDHFANHQQLAARLDDAFEADVFARCEADDVVFVA